MPQPTAYFPFLSFLFFPCHPSPPAGSAIVMYHDKCDQKCPSLPPPLSLPTTIYPIALSTREKPKKTKQKPNHKTPWFCYIYSSIVKLGMRIHGNQRGRREKKRERERREREKEGDGRQRGHERKIRMRIRTRARTRKHVEKQQCCATSINNTRLHGVRGDAMAHLDGRTAYAIQPTRIAQHILYPSPSALRYHHLPRGGYSTRSNLAHVATPGCRFRHAPMECDAVLYQAVFQFGVRPNLDRPYSTWSQNTGQGSG
ncbi:hypothetical protein F5X96DRAFT_34202 [Biscogniauxia mediterranea]|nr:hypothetical protein F5X96DRAFT_34202 [Biscogniauxia mediterranea]